MTTWQELVAATDEELGARDIAETHLACAVGLPGAQGLDIPDCLRQIDAFAAAVRKATERLMPVFQKHPDRFKSSEPHFRMMCLMTVMQRDFGIKTDPKLNSDDPDCSDSRDLFLHGVLQGRGGNCSSLPVLYVAIGRRLGYPLKLVHTESHLFARWDSPTDRFNIECTVQGLDTPPNEYYLSWPKIPKPAEAHAGFFLVSLTPRHELAGFLKQRFWCLRRNLRYREAIESCIGACVAAPENILYENATNRFLREWHERLHKFLPARFPQLWIDKWAARRYPDRIPHKVELDILALEALETLLTDEHHRREWWPKLNKPFKHWPANVPTVIRVSGSGRKLFQRSVPA